MKPLRNLYIAIVIPSTGRIVAPLIMRLIKWGKMGAEINIVAGAFLDVARNMAVRQFLKSKNQYFLFIDSDTIPENVDDLKKLMKYKKDIIGGLYNCVLSKDDGQLTTRPSAYSMIFDSRTLVDAVAVMPKTGLQKVVGMCTGYMMVKREVFEKMPEPWFEFKWADDKHTAFQGEDIGFCEKAIKQGYKLYCDTNCTALHVKEIML